MTVDVGIGRRHTHTINDNRRIEDVHLDGWPDRHVDRPLSLHRGIDRSGCPASLVLQNKSGQRGGIVHSYAPVTEVTANAAEELRLRRTVQVDVVLIGKDELDEAQRVVGTRTLPESKLPAGDATQVLR